MRDVAVMVIFAAFGLSTLALVKLCDALRKAR